MAKKVELQIGDRIDLCPEKPPSYRTILEDMDENGLLLVSQPFYRGRPVLLRREQELELFFNRNGNFFCIDVRVSGFRVSGTLRFVALEAVSEPRKVQRRESYRFDVSLTAILRRFDDGPFPEDPDEEDPAEMESVFTENLSETGTLLRTKQEYSVGEELFLRVFLRWPTEDAEPLELSGKIRKVDYDHAGDCFRLGVQFLCISDRTRSHLAKYIIIEQQRLLREKRLAVSDD